MEIELEEIRNFIAQHPPFDVLEPEILNTVTKQLTIRYFRRGNVFPETESVNNLVIIKNY